MTLRRIDSWLRRIVGAVEEEAAGAAASTAEATRAGAVTTTEGEEERAAAVVGKEAGNITPGEAGKRTPGEEAAAMGFVRLHASHRWHCTALPCTAFSLLLSFHQAPTRLQNVAGDR